MLDNLQLRLMQGVFSKTNDISQIDVSFLFVCLVVDYEFRHNIVKVAVDKQTTDNVMTNALKPDINLFFKITNCQIVRSCSLTHRINYKFMCLSPIDNKN